MKLSELDNLQDVELETEEAMIESIARAKLLLSNMVDNYYRSKACNCSSLKEQISRESQRYFDLIDDIRNELIPQWEVIFKAADVMIKLYK